jgi:hypothetical protein
LTIIQVFSEAGLSPLGPVSWKTPIPEPAAGVYVVARVGDPAVGCDPCAFPFIEPVPPDLALDLEYERKRWLPDEPIIYIGATTRPIHKRVGEFYRHKCGKSAPHAGGQVVKLLTCGLWVYWSPAPDPMEAEQTMICAFKDEAGQIPFANGDDNGNKKRIRCPR